MKRKRKKWSLKNFDDGYVDNKGRFRVWLPDHPRSYEGGYILRSIVAFEAYYDIFVPKDVDIHHIDGNRLNDSKENLAMIPHGIHSSLTNTKKSSNVERQCENCNKIFTIKKFRLKDLSKGMKKRGRFCSQKCYHSYKRSDEHKKNISEGLKKAYREGRRN